MKTYIIGEISAEQFVPEHTFCYVIKGTMRLYDGNKTYTFRSGQASLIRKNNLLRYAKEKVDGEIAKVFITLNESFLKKFQVAHQAEPGKFRSAEAVLSLPPNELTANFIHSLVPYYKSGKLEPLFADVKREELLLILLKQVPEMAGVLFDYGIPQKINLEAFMNRNYKFNVSMERFAYLSGRSLSAFKRDFKSIFDDAPNHWLVRRRLAEAYFLIEKKHQRPSDIFVELGFEALSHFSFAFKKHFNLSPSDLLRQKQE
ncbi:helix-turn-helix domain-containing protein [Mucilaginibacter rigui]|uniref:helix-turn-helix domain-containing protein n=1 Tax=Mucilaginibacter rigui TaxID=534635 RepID=UPI00293BD4E7|nr:AraC family transcriptional regulator [Mucilaginibacter rigui]